MQMFKFSAMCFAVCLTAAGAHAQSTQGQKVTPGNDATKAVGSQVEPMKKECPDKTTTGNAGNQHAPTAGVGSQVPQMTAPGDCPDPSAAQKK
jgi:hypothetical protein